MIKNSIIVPVHNEVENVSRLYAQIVDSANRLNAPYEIIFVDDGSDDGTLEELKKLSPVIIVCLQKSYGQSCALDAGIKQARGERLITLDGDGQNDPEDIPALLKKMDEGYDAVCGWRYQRQDDAWRRFISAGAFILRKILVDDGVHDAGCTLRAYRSGCFSNLDIVGGMHRMIPALLCWHGFKITEIKVRHHPRLYGKSKQGYRRLVHGFINMVRIWYWRKAKKIPARSFSAARMAGRNSGYSIKNIIDNTVSAREK